MKKRPGLEKFFLVIVLCTLDYPYISTAIKTKKIKKTVSYYVELYQYYVEDKRTTYVCIANVGSKRTAYPCSACSTLINIMLICDKPLSLVVL